MRSPTSRQLGMFVTSCKSTHSLDACLSSMFLVVLGSGSALLLLWYSHCSLRLQHYCYVFGIFHHSDTFLGLVDAVHATCRKSRTTGCWVCTVFLSLTAEIPLGRVHAVGCHSMEHLPPCPDQHSAVGSPGVETSSADRAADYVAMLVTAESSGSDRTALEL